MLHIDNILSLTCLSICPYFLTIPYSSSIHQFSPGLTPKPHEFPPKRNVRRISNQQKLLTRFVEENQVAVETQEAEENMDTQVG